LADFELVKSLLAMSLWLRFCASRKGGTRGGGWVHRPWLAPGGQISLLLCMNGLRKQSSGLVWPSFLTAQNFFLVCMGDHWPRAVTIENSLMSGCCLSHESAKNGCKGSWVKCWASKPKGTGNMVHLRDP